MPVSIQIWRRPTPLEVWRFVGFVSTVVGLLCYALSSSFINLFGEWNFFKIFLYVIFSFIIFFMPLVANVWQGSVSILFKTHMAILLLLATSVYSVLFDKAVNQKPDAYILISSAAFAVMSLSLSKQTQYGCEVDLLNFFLGFLITLLMKRNMWLFFVGAGFSYSLTIIRSWSDITPQSEDFEPHDHVAIEVDSLRHQVPDEGQRRVRLKIRKRSTDPETEYAQPKLENPQLTRSPSLLLQRLQSIKVSSLYRSDTVHGEKEPEPEREMEGLDSKMTEPASETTWLREEGEEVDAKADDFINRFRKQLRLQRLDSILRNRQMVKAN